MKCDAALKCGDTDGKREPENVKSDSIFFSTKIILGDHKLEIIDNFI